MATTTPDNLWSPDLTTAYVPTTDLAMMQTTVQTALNNIPRVSRAGLDSGRTSPSGWTPTEGVQYYSTDTDRNWFYNGTTWIPADTGAYLIRPTSLTGATIQADGRIVPTSGVTNMQFNGIFSPRFRSYRVDFSLNLSSAVGTSINLTANGVVYSGATYNSQRFTAIGGSASASSSSSGTAFPGAGLVGQFLTGTWLFHNPSHAGPKYLSSDVMQAPGMGVALERGWCGSVDANLYDGFRFTATSGGTLASGDAPFIKIYGMA